MRDEHVGVHGLEFPAEISVDRWGIAHITAENSADLFFAQGFNVARDRLWQIDLWRKRGLGLLSEDFGPGYLEQDRACRLFLYRGEMDVEWNSYSPDAKYICERFVAGINAYIDLCEREPERLPPEFGDMAIRPKRWQAEDVVRIRSHSLMRNCVSEVLRSNILLSESLETDGLRQKLEPFPEDLVNETVIPVPIQSLDDFRLATAAVSFNPERLGAKPEDSSKWRKLNDLGDVVRDTNGQGSNNWVVHGSRTATGRPILANDPHRVHSLPSLRYMVHLKCPELNVIGAGEPALPGIAIGHNGTAAFGLTLFMGHDQEDVYVYDTHSEDPNLYRYDDGWERLITLEETLQVKGSAPATITLQFTRHGPVIYRYPNSNKVVAIRTVWTLPGAAPYFRSIATMRSRSFTEFREKMAGWSVPAVNQVYADVSGDVGWVVGGASPVRRNWSGLLPVTGDGSFEWDGFVPGKDLPFAYNPAKGFVATANEFNVPRECELPRPIGYEWLEPSRANRIEMLLARPSGHSVEDSKRIQTDVHSLPAERLCGMLRDLHPRTTTEARALGLLRGWDFRLSEDSAAAALFETWWSSFLRPALTKAALSDKALAPLMLPGDVAAILDHLSIRGIDPVYRDLLLSTLSDAYADCEVSMGRVALEWRWGGRHQAHFSHPLTAAVPGRRYDVGPLPFSGSESTPMNGSYRLSDYRLTIGASFRIVVDVGQWDNSVCVNTPGQSGDPRSEHYADLVPIWSGGEYVPLLYSEAAIESVSTRKIRLLPS